MDIPSSISISSLSFPNLALRMLFLSVLAFCYLLFHSLPVVLTPLVFVVTNIQY